MQPAAIHVEPSAWAAATRAAIAAAPREFVAIVGGRTWAGIAVVDAIEPLAALCTNDAFAVDAVAFAAAEAALRARGLEWLGFLHSHPHGAAVPSSRDRRELWRDCVQIVVATNGRTARGAAFWLRSDAVSPVPLHVGSPVVEAAR